jgi:sulfide:quinone oxidoreductase
VLIAGGGVAGLETLLALRAIAGDRLDVTVLAPGLKFVNPSMSVDSPFKPNRARGIRWDRICHDFGASWVRGELNHVEHLDRQAITRNGERLAFDRIVLAIGARPGDSIPRSLTSRSGSRTLTYCGIRDNPEFARVLHHVRDGRIKRLAFVKPVGATWPQPLYDLALMTAAWSAGALSSALALTFVTPEESPLGIFGKRVSAAARDLLEQAGVTLLTSSYAHLDRDGRLAIAPGGNRHIEVDQVVTEPRLVGPRMRGVPCDRDGFIPTDGHGRVPGRPGVFAAGDATWFSVKQGGLAAQQADGVAEAVAASVGIEVQPREFRPVLRAVLLTGREPLYVRADISGGAGDDSSVSEEALWWPPTKLAGRYLAPYLSNQAGEARDVMPEPVQRAPAETQACERGDSSVEQLADLLATTPG